MIGNAHTRRAEEFDAALSGRATSGTQQRYAELLDVVSGLRSVPAPAARPAYVAALRGQLVREAGLMPATPHADRATELKLTPTRTHGRRERRLAAIIGGFAVVAASGSMAVASQGALPGDVLYPVKRAIENAHANLQSSPDAKASVLLDNAENRLSEVEELSARGDSADAGEITSTLQAFKDQTSQASTIAIDDFSKNGDDSGLTDVHSFADASMSRLVALDDVLPAEARPALVAAAQTIRSVDLAASDACPTCIQSPLTQLPDFATKALTGVVVPGRPPSSGSTTAKASPAQRAGSTPTGPSAGHSSSTAPPSLPALPGLPSDDSGQSAGSGGDTGTSDDQHVVPDTINKITKGLLGGGGTTTQSSADPSSSPDVVGGLNNLLGLDN
ncbi:DUF5667 domain-containing protein [Nocardioides montaniterrae]